MVVLLETAFFVASNNSVLTKKVTMLVDVVMVEGLLLWRKWKLEMVVKTVLS